jgi:putative Mn2+ efflux pump MntP
MLETGVIMAAVILGVIHSIAPDHWMPFVVVSRAERWGLSRSVLVALAGGLGHITTSVLIGIGVILIGMSVSHRLENFESLFSGSLLFVFGLAYTIMSMRHYKNDYKHVHHDHSHDTNVLSYSLILIASVSPCVPFIPVMVASIPYGGMTMALTLVCFVLSTLFVIGVLVFLSLKSLHSISHIIEKRINVFAGFVLMSIGVGVLIGLF